MLSYNATILGVCMYARETTTEMRKTTFCFLRKKRTSVVHSRERQSNDAIVWYHTILLKVVLFPEHKNQNLKLHLDDPSHLVDVFSSLKVITRTKRREKRCLLATTIE